MYDYGEDSKQNCELNVEFVDSKLKLLNYGDALVISTLEKYRKETIELFSKLTSPGYSAETYDTDYGVKLYVYNTEVPHLFDASFGSPFSIYSLCGNSHRFRVTYPAK